MREQLLVVWQLHAVCAPDLIYFILIRRWCVTAWCLFTAVFGALPISIYVAAGQYRTDRMIFTLFVLHSPSTDISLILQDVTSASSSGVYVWMRYLFRVQFSFGLHNFSPLLNLKALSTS